MGRIYQSSILITEQVEDTDIRAAQELKEVFHTLCLPVPEENQCLTRRHGDYLVPLSACGCTLQITQTDEPSPALRHPHILQPLAEFRKESWRVRIMPGVFLRGNEEQCEELRQVLKKDHIDFHDDVVANIGNVPITTPQFPEGIPVVIDMDAIYALPGFNLSLYQEADDPQTYLYQPLRQQLAEALSMDDPVAMRQFWRTCEANRTGQDEAQPSLISGWTEVKKQYGDDRKSRDVKDIAMDYAQMVRQYWRIHEKEQSRPRKDKGALLI